jgi:CRP/FNR family transcriptional regulator, cyclic AMP receptor protein
MNGHATGAGGNFWGLLSNGDRASLAAVGRMTKFRPGDFICVEGEPATHVFVLISGWVKVLSATRDGRKIVSALRGEGEIVGELAGESGGYRTASMQAIDGVRALIVGYDAFASFLDSSTSAARSYRSVVTQRWGDAADMLRDRATTNAAQRLAALLLDLADRHGTRDQQGVMITLPLSQLEIASLIGASRSTVIRALADWRRRGFIRTRQWHVTITDMRGLRRVAGQ